MKQSALVVAGLAILATGCSSDNSKPQSNPLLDSWDTQKVGIPFEQIRLSHYEQAFNEGIAQQNRTIQGIINSPDFPTFENTIEALEQSDVLVSRVCSVLSSVKAANGNKQLNSLNAKLGEALTKQIDSIYFNEALFKRVEAVYQQFKNGQLPLSVEKTRLLENIYKQFANSGIALPEDKKKQVMKINAALSKLGSDFGDNLNRANTSNPIILSETQVDQYGLGSMKKDAKEAAEGLPLDVLSKSQAPQFAFFPNMPTAEAFLTRCSERSYRELMYKSYVNRAQKSNGSDTKKTNPEIILEMAELRAEKARIMGGENACHADLVLKDRMGIKKPKELHRFLSSIMSASVEQCKVKELSKLQALAKADGVNTLEPWDWRYYQNMYLKSLNFDTNQMTQYFRLDKVRNAAFGVAKRLWNIEFVEKPYQVYQKDVKAYAVVDRGQMVDGQPKTIGIFYADHKLRSGKDQGAWCSDIRPQYVENGKNIIPIVYNVCNCKGDYLDMDEVTTLFHEFGHAMHGLLSNVRYRSQSCMNVPKDFVEMPSQIMEYWATDEGYIKEYATNDKGEPLPESLWNQYKAVSSFGQHFKTIEYTAASLLDLEWHNKSLVEIKAMKQGSKLPNEMVMGFDKAVATKIGLNGQSGKNNSVVIPITFRYNSPYFKHIFGGNSGYDAGYYVYLAAEQYDADAFQAFRESDKGVFDQELGLKLRNHVYSVGGSVDIKDSYKKFRGQAADIKYMYIKRDLAVPGEN